MHRVVWSVLLSLLLAAGACGCSGGTEGGAGVDAAVAVDENGPRWYLTCGDPVCSTEPPPENTCGDREAGDACTDDGASCEPGVGCGAQLVCADSDPTEQGCPDSQRRVKQHIRYVDAEHRQALIDELMAVRLATYEYRRAPGQARLGFIIDDAPSSFAVLPRGERVDVYGYASLAVAAIQGQEARIRQLEARVAELVERTQTCRGDE